MFYQIEVNRISHTGTNASYGDTVALIKDKFSAIDFAQVYSNGTNDRQTNCVVHVTGLGVDQHFRNGKKCHWHGRFIETTPEEKKRTDMEALWARAEKRGGIGRCTDRELSQMRRSMASIGSDFLYSVIKEQWRRGLLKPSRTTVDYGNEKLKNVSDYPETQKSPRINK